MGKRKSVRVRVKRWGGGTKTDNMGKLLIKTLRESFNIPNGLKKLWNLRHCFQNDFPIKSTINTKFREKSARLLLFKSIRTKLRTPNQTCFEYVLVFCVKTHNK